MKPQFKTPEAVAFLDLMREMKERFGYNQNRVAEIARISAAMVSQIVSGERSPGRPSLELLRRHYEDLTVPAPGPGTAKEPDRLQEQLDDLKRYAPNSYEAARTTIGALHEQAAEVIVHEKGKPKVSSASVLARNKMAAAVGKHALKGGGARGDDGGERERRSEADERTSRKGQPHRASDHPTRLPRPAREEEGKR